MIFQKSWSWPLLSRVFFFLACVGVHPWCLHEVTQDDWKATTNDYYRRVCHTGFKNMEDLLIQHPQMPVRIVGEIVIFGFGREYAPSKGFSQNLVH
jgi:Tat protein secretion system quality control protein TatD with DNase activity